MAAVQAHGAAGRGTFTIAGGTRAFRGTTGTGTYTRRIQLTGARSNSGACLHNKASAIHGIIQLTGKAAVPSA